MGNNLKNGTERRSYVRINYRPAKRAVLKIGAHEFEIADISEGGIRFINEQKVAIEKPVRGTATFLYGDSFDVEGDIVWEQNNELGLLLKRFIPAAAMEKEKQYVILDGGWS